MELLRLIPVCVLNRVSLAYQFPPIVQNYVSIHIDLIHAEPLFRNTCMDLYLQQNPINCLDWRSIDCYSYPPMNISDRKSVV